MPHGCIQFFWFLFSCRASSSLLTLHVYPICIFPSYPYTHGRLLQKQAENSENGDLAEYFFLSVFDPLYISAETQN